MSKIIFSPGVQMPKDLVLAELQNLANKVGDLIVTSGLRTGDPGQHGLGLAADIVVPAYAGQLLDLYITSERFSWKGIGVYPDWQYNGQVIGGLHLDLRAGPPARWMGLGRGKDNKYIALSSENLKKYGVV